MNDKSPGGLPKVVLSDGRTVELNLYAVKRGDILAIAAAPAEERDALATTVYVKVTGLSRADIDDLPYPDWYAIDQKMQKLLVNPLADPN